MGWWSTDIMGGDTPLDFKSVIIDDKLGLDQFKAKPAQVKAAFEGLSEKSINEMIPRIVNKWGCGEEGSDSHNDYLSMGYQVLAVLMMECGAQIRPTTFKKMEKYIPLDQWALSDDERNAAIDNLLKVLFRYDGTPIKINSKGLLEVFAEHISEGKSGLINKNI